MPFKNFSAPTVLTSLRAEIVGAAQLETEGMFGVITNDPVSLSIHQFSATGAGKVINISLGSASDLAFINRDVVVVRSGDDLWALVDIHHKARMDQVGRDIRSLHGSPKGDKALAIAWDGQAASLELRQYEVGGRQFVLRGDLRTADLGNNETYVVVEGGAGQFRVHPGLTPEAGATARVDLPADASKLDKLRGGRELSVLYKKGASQLCVISRNMKNELAAKMVTLDTAALAAVTVATTLFTIGSDGKLRMFNGDTISRATPEEAMTPTAIVSVPARAEPTLLAATAKGTVRIWVGTRAGDLIRVDANKAGLDLST